MKEHSSSGGHGRKGQMQPEPGQLLEDRSRQQPTGRSTSTHSTWDSVLDVTRATGGWESGEWPEVICTQKAHGQGARPAHLGARLGHNVNPSGSSAEWH